MGLNIGREIRNLFSGATKQVERAGQQVQNTVGQAVKDVASRPVNFAQSVFESAPAQLVKAPAQSVTTQQAAPAPKKRSFWQKIGDAVGGVVNRVGDAVRGVATGVVDTVVGAVKNVGEGITTFAGGVGKIFTGRFGEGFKDMGLGLVKTFLQTPADAVLMLGGRAISAVQTLIGVEPPGRKLTGDEIATLRKVYGDSIDYSSVRIKEGNAGLFSLTGRAFTHGNTIYIPPNNLPLTKDLLVHEMAHVWQHQNGGTDYMSEALWAQNFGDGYDFEKGIKEGKSWSQLNPEQQAELLQEAQSRGFFDSPNARFIVNGNDYTDYLKAALDQVRAGKGAP